ncbi:HlyD family efflux transporter periplasmic adaptor subunit [Gilvimarinus sp. SDUM040013]|uniref:HlyD family efflux transporter periplasmic adaptor subunit n=1 Tax=Gilvimarinus gilvus TaxID=3058038 RepID=A0ABU4S1T2_9GAMM|nr:HlyD family efflux transporter periplasmic adaptor subunit [Gilvimarinus sp. SDUM040013]MDO3386007.1 HlyD family efflux transporter periplasmic adaptor subunit [Gilvimarinus sp. SDUM040013]MDX6850461.1 HlyD family efflux transporter periplasmic adaptor subunit [Gilvimarinus sp. SDUM040013]
MPNDLFRSEAVESFNDRLSGRVVLSPSRAVTSVLFAILILILLFVVAAFLLSYSSTSNLKGWITTGEGVSNIYGRNGYNLVQLYVANGDLVNKGEVVARIQKNQYSDYDKFLHQQLEQLEVLIGEKQRANDKEFNEYRGELLKQRKKIAKEIDLLIEELSQLSEAVTIYEAVKLANASLYEKSLISELQWANVKREELGLNERVLYKQRLISERRRELSSLNVEISRIDGLELREKLSISFSLIDLASQNSLLGSSEGIKVVSPLDGEVIALDAKRGDSLTNENVLMSITRRNSQYTIEAWAPMPALENLSLGQEARVEMDTYPAEKYGYLKASVVSIGEKPTLPSDTLFAPVSSRIPVYKVTLAFSDVPELNEKMELKLGMLLNVKVVQRKQKLYKWVEQYFKKLGK